MISQASCAEAAPWDEKAMYMQGFGFEFDKCKVKKEKEVEKYKKFPTISIINRAPKVFTFGTCH